MIYTRKENCGAYDRITTVTDSGEYEQIVVWPDGIVTSHYKTALKEMGWSGTAEFLNHKKGFTATT